MIENSTKWEEEQVPEALNHLLHELRDQQEYITDHDDLENGELYAQYFQNGETEQIHLGYYLPEVADEFNMDEPFRQEFFIQSKPNGAGRHVQLLYASEPIEIFADVEGFERRISWVSEELFEALLDEATSQGLFQWVDIEERLSVS